MSDPRSARIGRFPIFFVPVLALGLLATFLLSGIARADLPLDKDGQKCANAAVKGASKVVATYGKEAAACVKSITSGKQTGSAAECIGADAKSKISKSEGKLSEAIDKRCLALAYPMDCPAPCDAADAGGASDGIDDATEWKSCQACINAASSWAAAVVDPSLTGVHQAILDGVTLAPVDQGDLGKCQSSVVKAYEKLFATTLKEFAGCAKIRFKAATTEPPAVCVGSDLKNKISKAAGKLDATIAKCAAAAQPPFDGGDCAGLSDSTLAECLESVVSCRACRWSSVQTGAAVNCDLLDDGAGNGSCVNPTVLPTTTTTTTSSTTTTTSSTTSTSDTTTTTSTTSSTSTTTSTSSTTTTMGGLVWPPDLASYVFGPLSYLDTLTIPTVVSGVPTCCVDFGTISRDFIQSGTNNFDNALAGLDGTLAAFGLDLQVLIDDAITSGELILLFDHQFLNTGALPDDFALVALDAVFDAGTTYTEASAGAGEFSVNPSTFVGATGTPTNFFFPSVMTPAIMSAGPASLELPLPIGVGLLELSVNDGLLDAAHGPITPAGIDYSAGALSGYVELSDIFTAVNAILDGPDCSCLGHSSSVFYQNASGAWTATCVSDTSGCTAPGEAICATLAGTNLFGGQVCLALPGFINGAADLDLNPAQTGYEGFSVGLQFTATTAVSNGLLP